MLEVVFRSHLLYISQSSVKTGGYRPTIFKCMYILLSIFKDTQGYNFYLTNMEQIN